MSDTGTGDPPGVGFEAVDRPMVTWTLSLLPALIGAGGVAATVIGAVLAGVTDGRQGWPFTLLAALLVTGTVVVGASFGLYSGLAIVAVGALVADGGPSTAEKAALVSTLVVVHEVVRFSLDARQPSRFGPGLVVGVVGRTVGVGCAAVALVLAFDAVADRLPSAEGWIPVGVAAAALPLFVLWGAERLDRVAPLGRPLVRAAIATVATVAVVALVVIGAEARSQVVSSGSEEGPATTIAPTTTLVPESVEGEGSTSTTVLGPWTVVLVLVVLAVLLYLMLRRPEAAFDLDEMEQPGEGSAFELGVAGLADGESELLTVDEDVLSRLLGDLQLDMAAEPDPGRAIRFGYATIERRLADAGVARADHETEREFLVRAMPPLGGAAGAMTSLTGLFERARFGHDAVPEAHREQALAAIDDLLGAISDLGTGGGSLRRHPGPGGRS